MRVACEHSRSPRHRPSPCPRPHQFPLTAAVSKAITLGESRKLSAAEQVGALSCVISQGEGVARSLRGRT